MVTIGVCVRNCSSTIGRAIKSIITQDFPHELIEVILVDDGSEDDTLSVIRDFMPKMNMRVKIFHHKWRGLGPSRNVVVNNASGKYILWVDGDMIIPSDYVKKQVDFMEKNPTVAIAGGSYELSPTTSLIAFLDNIMYVVYRMRLGGKKSSGNLPGTGGAIYRTEVIKKIGGFDENIRGSGEDVDIAYRVKTSGWTVVRDKAPFFGKCRETWKDLWGQYVWHGYGAHYIGHKHKNAISLPKMLPPVAFLKGIIYSITAYKVTRRKASFLLPFHGFFKHFAWLVGFTKSHLDKYGGK